MFTQDEIDRWAPLVGEYGYYGDYIYPEEFKTGDEDFCDEQWMPITENHNYYVSTCGRVWSSATQRFVKLKRLDSHGHLGVCLAAGAKKPVYRYIHRLMAEAFLPNPNKLPVVRHFNDDPSDNQLYNLGWGTQKDNMRDCKENGRAYIPTDEDRRKGNLPRMIPVVAINERSGVEQYFESATEAARCLGIPQANIWKVLHGERARAKGYNFVWSCDKT